jgi:hypothetical protein
MSWNHRLLRLEKFSPEYSSVLVVPFAERNSVKPRRS